MLTEPGSKPRLEVVPDRRQAAASTLSGRRRPVGWAAGRVARRADTSVQTFGRLLAMGGAAAAYLVGDLARGRFLWRDTIAQAWFQLSVTAIPALLVSVPFGVIVSLQVGSLISQVGASSMSGAAGGLGVIRQGAPMVSALLLGGAAGSAVATDLGARSIREEVDALRVMGIDPVRRLVVPRLAAMLMVAPILCVLIIFVGLSTGYVVSVTAQSVTPGSYIASFASFATTADFYVALVKSAVFGLVVILIACQRGLETRGGPRAVADAANASVVLGVVSVFVVNVAITQLAAMFMPTRVG